MPNSSSKRASSRSLPTRNSADGGSAKKQKTDDFDDDGDREEEDVTQTSNADAPDMMDPESQAKTEEEKEEARRRDHKTILQVLDNIKENPTRLGVVRVSLGLLGQLVHDDEHLMKFVLEADGISLVANIMRDNPDEEGLQTEGQSLLRVLCKQVGENPDKKGIETIMTVMKTVPGNAGLQTDCSDVLRGAAYNGFREFIGVSGGIPIIIAALQHHKNDYEVLHKCMWALMGLTYRSESNCQRVANAGGIEVSIDALKRHPANIKMQNCVGVLCNLVVRRKELIKPIIDANGHVAVVSFMKCHTRNPTIQNSGCWTLTVLVSGNIEGVVENIVGAGAIPTVVGAMNRHPKDVGVQKGSCSFLCKLSEGGDNIDNILTVMNEADARAALSAAIDAHPSNIHIVTWAKDTWNRLVNALPCLNG